jgi:hypothetical protein
MSVRRSGDDHQKETRNERRPAVRAASVQDILAYLDDWEPGTGERVRAEIPADVLEIVDSTPRMGWIDVEDDVHVPTAIWSVLGDDDASEMMTQFLSRHFETAPLRPLLAGVRKVFGLSPMNVLRILPSGWRVVYRDVSTVRVRGIDTASAEIVLEDLAPTVVRSANYLGSFRAIFIALIGMTGFTGSVEITRIDREKREASYHFRWQRP